MSTSTNTRYEHGTDTHASTAPISMKQKLKRKTTQLLEQRAHSQQRYEDISIVLLLRLNFSTITSSQDIMFKGIGFVNFSKYLYF